MSIYKLHDQQSAAGAALQSLDIQFDGRITGVHFAVAPDLDAADEDIAVEVSFGSTSTLANNDARMSIFSVRGRLSLMTAEAGILALNSGISGLNIPVVAGERVYLNSSGVVAKIDCYLYVEDRVNTNIRRRR